ncbi:hypothetical protein AAHC03_0324 [Spirometra sp. Aus1]
MNEDFLLEKRQRGSDDAEGEGAVRDTTVYRWYEFINFGDISFEDQYRSGRPSKLDNEDLLSTLEHEPSSSSRDLGGVHGVDHKIVLRHLNQFDFAHKKPHQEQ